jgi:hypothetical protein
MLHQVLTMRIRPRSIQTLSISNLPWPQETKAIIKAAHKIAKDGRSTGVPAAPHKSAPP